MMKMMSNPLFTSQKIKEFTANIHALSVDLVKKSQSQDFSIEIKHDGSKVTSADLYSDKIIKDTIKNIFNTNNIISEEDNEEKRISLLNSGTYFLIDPIDGTDSFIKKRDFSINISYINNHKVEFGLIADPLTKGLYYTLENNIFDINHIKIKRPVNNTKTITVATGQKNFSGAYKDKFDAFLNKLRQSGYEVKDTKIHSAGLKYLSTILGNTDISISFGPVKDWDISMLDIMAKITGCRLMQVDRSQIVFEKDSMSHENGILLISSNINLE